MTATARKEHRVGIFPQGKHVFPAGAPEKRFLRKHASAAFFPAILAAIVISSLALPSRAADEGKGVYARAEIHEVAGQTLMVIQKQGVMPDEDRVMVYRAVPGEQADGKVRVGWELLLDDMQGLFYGSATHGNTVALFFEKSLVLLFQAPGGGPWKWKQFPLHGRFLPETGVSDGKRLIFFGKSKEDKTLAGAVYMDGEIRPLPHTELIIESKSFQLISFLDGETAVLIWRAQSEKTGKLEDNPVYVELSPMGEFSAVRKLSLEAEGLMSVMRTGGKTWLFVHGTSGRDGEKGLQAGILSRGVQSQWTVNVRPVALESHENSSTKDVLPLYSLHAAVVSNRTWCIETYPNSLKILAMNLDNSSAVSVSTEGLPRLSAGSSIIYMLLVGLGVAMFTWLVLFRKPRRRGASSGF